jgi:hypothetical protein
MIQNALTSLLLASTLTLTPAEFPNTASAQLTYEAKQPQVELSSKSISLDKRYGGVDLPENVYKDNILLNLAYMSGRVKSKNDIYWDELKKPFIMEFSLEPGQRFAYHDTQLVEYAQNVVLTTNSTFSAGDGYKYEGGLYGMGVCHLASIIHWVALDAGLESVAPSNHDFYPIPEIPKQYGVAIYFSPDSPLASANQNLYIKNTLDSKVTFRFEFDGDNLKVSVAK